MIRKFVTVPAVGVVLAAILAGATTVCAQQTPPAQPPQKVFYNLVSTTMSITLILLTHIEDDLLIPNETVKLASTKVGRRSTPSSWIWITILDIHWDLII